MRIKWCFLTALASTYRVALQSVGGLAPLRVHLFLLEKLRRPRHRAFAGARHGFVIGRVFGLGNLVDQRVEVLFGLVSFQLPARERLRGTCRFGSPLI
jgi:hypothetical protein